MATNKSWRKSLHHVGASIVEEAKRNDELQRLYERRKSKGALALIGVAGILMAAGLFHHPASTTTTTTNNTETPTQVQATQTPSAQQNTPSQQQTAALVPPPFVYQKVKGDNAPQDAMETAARFTWLDTLSAQNGINPQDVLNQIKSVTTPGLYQQMASSFDLPTQQQTWVNVEAKTVKKLNNGWSIETTANVKDDSGNLQSISMTDTVIKEGSGWVVSQVSLNRIGS